MAHNWLVSRLHYHHLRMDYYLRKLLSADDGQYEPSPPIEGDATCRICFADDKKGMCTPCKCSGTSAYVHRSCILMWIMSPNPRGSPLSHQKCDVCLQRFILGLPKTDLLTFVRCYPWWSYVQITTLLSSLLIVLAIIYVFGSRIIDMWFACVRCVESDGYSWLFSPKRERLQDGTSVDVLPEGLVVHPCSCRCYFHLFGLRFPPIVTLMWSLLLLSFCPIFIMFGSGAFLRLWTFFKTWNRAVLDLRVEYLSYRSVS